MQKLWEKASGELGFELHNLCLMERLMGLWALQTGQSCLPPGRKHRSARASDWEKRGPGKLCFLGDKGYTEAAP